MKTTRRRSGATTDTGHSELSAAKAPQSRASTPPAKTPRPDSARAAETDGRVIGGRYRLEALLGIGGSASVWRAADLALEAGGQRDVAVKLLHPYLVPDGTSRARLLAEADTLRRLDHPGIVQLRDVVLDGADAALVFDYVSGGSLAAELDRARRLDPRRAAVLAAGVAAALEYAHRRGVVHRDVTPGNILIDADGRPRLADFGIARLLEERVPVVTATGTVLGTLRYMAPEHLGGQSADARADVYSLGAVLYEMLAGRPAFDARTPVGLVGQQAAGPPPLPEDVPPPLAAIALAAMRRDPALRPPDAGALGGALESWLSDDRVSAAWLPDAPTTDRIEPVVVASRAAPMAADPAMPEQIAAGAPKRGTVRAVPALAPAALVARRGRAQSGSPFGAASFATFAAGRTRAVLAVAAGVGLALAVATAFAFVGGSATPAASPIAAAPRGTVTPQTTPDQQPTATPPSGTQAPAATSSPPAAAPVVVRATPIAAAPAPAHVVSAQQPGDNAHANRGHHRGHGRSAGHGGGDAQGTGDGGSGTTAGNGGDGGSGRGGGGGD